MIKNAIEFEQVAKLYRLGEIGTGTISHDLNRFYAKIRGKEDPFQKVGQSNDRSQKAERGEVVWALKDINFEVKKGEVMGIIGKNGAGKSTLLKLLSRVTSPTNGEIRVQGRLASLLEVGTGFHPELTGRENIYMNGTIMGMRKGEIDRKLDEIVDFAGVAKYLDTPTKRYSSGMTVRLGFAVAAFLEPEILVVDEVLAVGDADFQKKAVGKMKDVSSNQGRTVLFVSHNMNSIKTLCHSALVLEKGKIEMIGNTEDAIRQYLNFSNQFESKSIIEKADIYRSLEGKVDGASSFLEIDRLTIMDENHQARSAFKSNEKILIKIDFHLTTITPDLRLVISVSAGTDSPFLTTQLTDLNPSESRQSGSYEAICEIPKNTFGTNDYLISLQIISPKREHYKLNGIIHFNVKYENENYIYGDFGNALTRPIYQWTISKQEKNAKI